MVATNYEEGATLRKIMWTAIGITVAIHGCLIGIQGWISTESGTMSLGLMMLLGGGLIATGIQEGAYIDLNEIFRSLYALTADNLSAQIAHAKSVEECYALKERAQWPFTELETKLHQKVHDLMGMAVRRRFAACDTVVKLAQAKVHFDSEAAKWPSPVCQKLSEMIAIHRGVRLEQLKEPESKQRQHELHELILASHDPAAVAMWRHEAVTRNWEWLVQYADAKLAMLETGYQEGDPLTTTEDPVI